MDATDSGVGEIDTVPPVAAAPIPSFRAVALRLLAGRIRHPAALQGLLAFAIYLAVFVIGFGLPLARHLNVPNLRQYWTDPKFYTWAMRWWPYAVSHGINPLFSHQIGAPHGYNLAWATTTPSVDLLMWPVTAAFGVLVSYNVMLLLVPPVSAWAAFIAARRLTGRFWPALLAGAVYGFCALRGDPQLAGPAEPHGDRAVPAHGVPGAAVVGRDAGPDRVRHLADASPWPLEFYTFNEAFADMTAVLGGRPGDRLRGRRARGLAARWPGSPWLTAIAYAGAVVLAAPYLYLRAAAYPGRVSPGSSPAFSLQPDPPGPAASQQLFG